MASFIPGRQTVGFSPYISTVNPELYGKVIMQKQAMYDQGVQRVQQYIDNTTGLKVGREIDQQYLNSKIEELKSNINNIAGSDFSKYDTIRQAGQFAANIYNDRRIQGAVISAHNKNDALNQLSEAKANGEYADSNADVVLEQIQRWENGDENATLGKQSYTPYDNYSERFTKYMKSVLPTTTTFQESVMGSDGKPMMYVIKDGKRTLLTEQEAQSHFAAFLTQDQKAATQVNLDARYYAKYSQEDFNSIIADKYSRRQGSLEESIRQLKEEQALNSGDNDLYQQYGKKINEYDILLKSIPSELSKDLEALRTDPLSVKMNYYKENLSKSASSRFVRNDYEYQIKEDPYQKALFERNKEAFDQMMEEKKFDQKEREMLLKSKGSGDGTSSFGNSTFTAKAMTDNEPYTAENYEYDLGIKQDSFKQRAAQLLVDVYGDSIDYVKSDGKGGFIITDQNKASQALSRIKSEYETGANGMKDKGFVSQYFEEEGGTGWKAWNAFDAQKKEWEDVKKSKGATFDFNQFVIDAGYRVEDLDKPIWQQNETYFGDYFASKEYEDAARETTLRDVLQYELEMRMGVSPTQKGWSPVKEKFVSSLRTGLSPYGRVTGAKSTFDLVDRVGRAINKHADSYRKGRKELDVEAKNIARKTLYPSLELVGGGTEEPAYRLGLSKIQGYLLDTGGEDYKKFTTALNNADKKGKSSLRIERNSLNNTYTATILGDEEPVTVAIPERIALDFSSEFGTNLENSDEVRLNHNYNTQARRYETGLTTKTSPVNKDYVFSYNIYKANSGGTYMDVFYKKAGVLENNPWLKMPEASRTPGTIDDFHLRINSLLALDKETFENKYNIR